MALSQYIVHQQNAKRQKNKNKKILKQRRKREYAEDENGERANEVYLLNINEGK